MAAPPENNGKEEWRDWAELPRDVLLAVLNRLDHINILTGPDRVCNPWRKATMDEPDLWRRIDMRFHCYSFYHREFLEMMRAAMRRSAGRCEAFRVEGYVEEEMLSLVGDMAPSLKSLRLINCRDIDDMKFKVLITKFSRLEELELSNCRAPSLKSLQLIECRDLEDTTFKVLITKFPMLEELELSNCRHRFPNTLEIIGDACPLLKRFRLSHRSFYSKLVDDNPAMAIAKMVELRSLQLTCNSLTSSGLEIILDNCPQLGSLDVRACYHVCMDDDMQAKCSRIKTAAS